jgi:sigma54-dependent transcription regulator
LIFRSRLAFNAAEQSGTRGASQSVDLLVERLVDEAKNQNITREAIEKEVGDLKQYIEENSRLQLV